MRRYAIAVASVGGCLGSAAFVVAWAKNDERLLSAGSAIVVAALALLGLAIGMSTWSDERVRAQESKQRETYSLLVFQLLSRFGAGAYDPSVEAKIRAEVATWADLDVLKALTAWNATYDKHVSGSLISNQQFVLSPAAAADFRTATAEVVRAVRKQLPRAGDATVADLRGALFNLPGAPKSD